MRNDSLGDPLPAGALLRLGSVRLRHKEGIRSVTFTADGKQVITAGGDGRVCFWSLLDGKEALQVHKPGKHPLAVCLSPNGKRFATAEGNAVRLWDAKTGDELRSIACEINAKGGVPLVFSSDGKSIATVAGDRTVRVWAVDSGKEEARLPPLADGVRCVVFTLDGKQLLTAGEQGETALRAWDLATGRLLRDVPLKTEQDFRVRPLAFSPDGRTLALECAAEVREKKGAGTLVYTGYRLCLREVASGTERLRTASERDVIWAAAFSADCKKVAMNGMGTQVIVWDAVTGEERHRLAKAPEASRPDGVTTLAFSPDGTRLATVGDAARVQVWDLTTGREMGPEATGHQAAVSAVAYAPGGQTVATAGEDGTIRLWESVSGRPLNVLRGHTGSVRSLAFSPDGRMLASGSTNREVRTWDVATGKELHAIQAVPRTAGAYLGVCPLAFTPDGKRLLSWGDDRRLHTWDTATGKELSALPIHLTGVEAPPPPGGPEEMPAYEQSIHAVCFSADARAVAIVMSNGAYVVDTASGRELLRLAGSNGPTSIAFAPDGRTLVIAGWDKKVHLWELTTAREVFQVDGLEVVNAVAFAADGQTVAVSAGFAGATMHILDVRTGQVSSRLSGQDCYTPALAFAPDGKTLLSGQRDTTALIWKLPSREATRSSQDPPRSQAELEALWSDLAETNVQKARAALWELVASPQAAVTLFKDRLHPVERVRPEQVRQLIVDLDNVDFPVRESAMKQLAARFAEAEAALKESLQGNVSAEAKRRIDTILEKGAPFEILRGEALQRVRAIEALEHIGTPAALQLLRSLAGGAPSARETVEARAACEHLTQRGGKH